VSHFGLNPVLVYIADEDDGAQETGEPRLRAKKLDCELPHFRTGDWELGYVRNAQELIEGVFWAQIRTEHSKWVSS
jgi:hypothetical protein